MAQQNNDFQPPGKVVYEVPQNVWDHVLGEIKKIDPIYRAMEEMKKIHPVEWLTVEEFLAKTKVSRWKFDVLNEAGVLNLRKVGRRYYIHSGEVRRYFDGELNIKA